MLNEIDVQRSAGEQTTARHGEEAGQLEDAVQSSALRDLFPDGLISAHACRS
jgi:hypothetical protein